MNADVFLLRRLALRKDSAEMSHTWSTDLKSLFGKGFTSNSRIEPAIPSLLYVILLFTH